MFVIDRILFNNYWLSLERSLHPTADISRIEEISNFLEKVAVNVNLVIYILNLKI